MTGELMRTIESTEELLALLASERAILYKHSTRCGLSTSALLHVEDFAEKFPAAELYMINVIQNRSVSCEAEDRLGIRHETPQVILVEGGQVMRHASHRQVNVETLSEWWSGVQEAPSAGN